jgi:hypothetical protein
LAPMSILRILSIHASFSGIELLLCHHHIYQYFQLSAHGAFGGQSSCTYATERTSSANLNS